MDYAISPNLDRAAVREAFARAGRAHVPEMFAPETAEAVARALETEEDWTLSVRAGGGAFEAPLKGREPASAMHRDWLAEAAVDGASPNMQHLFDTRRITYDGVPLPETKDALQALAAFLNGETFLGFVRDITGDDRPKFCDVQATRYRPGQMLTVHNDANAAKDRLYAYVLNFTRAWRTDWGGLLLFHDDAGHVPEGFTPAFNALNIFRVPQKHAVSYVAPYAAADRLSVTGWVRGRQPS